jgi:hypothetical protein
MNGPKKIAYNCKKATLLIEKKQLSQLSIREKLELRWHLAGCSVCRLFQRQSLLINTHVQNIFKSTTQKGKKLDSGFKEELQQRIERELDK